MDSRDTTLPSGNGAGAGATAGASAGHDSTVVGQELRAYLDVCPTCLGWEDPQASEAERLPAPGRQACPTCGLYSVEWDLVVAMDEQLDRLHRWERLDEAVRIDESDC